MKSNQSSVFGLTAILALLAFSILAQMPAGVPSLDEMAGDWRPMKVVANPPDVNNFHVMLIIGRDLTSFYCNPEDWLWGWGDQKWSAGYPLVTLTIAGKEYPATECRWCPYRALRRNTNCAGFVVQTDTRMINEQRAVLERIEITNPGSAETNAELTLSVSGILQSDGISILNTKQRKGFVTAICPAAKPDSVTNYNGVVRWQWNVSLPAGGTKEIGFVAGDGRASDLQKVQADVTHWSEHFSAEFHGFKQCWEQRWADAFTPGNHYFSGSLPVLVTTNAALKRNYYMGILTMLELERTQFPVFPRAFITSGERAPGTQFYWDASMGSTVWALLLVFTGKSDEARRIFARLGGNPDLQVQQVKQSLQIEHKPKLSDLFVPGEHRIAPVVWIAMGLAAFQQFVGINIIFYYGEVLWKAAGATEQWALQINLLTGFVNILATIPAILLVDRVGRKPLLLFGSVGMALTLGTMATIFASAATGAGGKLVISHSAAVWALVAANLYVISFGVSWGPVVWVLLGEMFPNRMRGAALAIAGATNWVANFAVTVSFLPLLKMIGLFGAYGLYSAAAFVSLLFVWKAVRETKGRTLEEM